MPVIVFIDADEASERCTAARPCVSPTPLETLLRCLGPYRELVGVVVSSQWAVHYSLPELKAALAPQSPESIVGTLWDAPPPVALGRYDHIMYWLTRRHVWRLPIWLALQSPGIEWPEARRDRVIPIGAALDAEATQQALRAALERYYWADLWWGDGPAPKATSRQLAHSLMVAWSIPRRRWPTFLGNTATEFEQRLELLLDLHAGAERHVRAGAWRPHWVHLPHAALEMRRPIELIADRGVDGLRRVHEFVWRADN